MYLKFVASDGQVIRYTEVKKRIILGMVREFKIYSTKKITIKAYKHNINITKEIKLLHDIYVNDFKEDFSKFENIYSKANIYVSSSQRNEDNILILFGSVYIDIKTRKFYSIPIINNVILLQNTTEVEQPYYYNTS